MKSNSILFNLILLIFALISLAIGISASISHNLTVGSTISYTPPVRLVTLDNQSATTAGTTNFYFKTGTNVYYSDQTCSNAITNITIPTRTYYTFGGYYDDANGGGTQYITAAGVFTNNLYAKTTNVTLYAKWTQIVVTVTLNNQSATTAGTTTVYFKAGTNKYYSNSACTSTLNSITIPTKNGYAFNGYYTSTNGGGTQYITAAGAFTNNLYTKSSNLTLYAYWTELIKITITLDNQGASAYNQGTQAIYFYKGINKYYSNSSCTQEITSITKPAKFSSTSSFGGQWAYTFLGYYTQTKGRGTQYITSAGVIASTLCQLESNTTLYANWMG